MRSMFRVRSARALTPTALGRALPVHADLASPPPNALTFQLAPCRASLARVSTRQSAKRFNQPLSFDTSKVTDMGYMFYVRSARALPPTALSRALPVHAATVAATQRPHASRAVPLPASYARLSTRQSATAFNQPLSFDTSSVTTMSYMFYVRSARALAPTALSRALPVHAACVAATQRPHASRAAPLPTSHARLSTRQSATAFNQPLSFDTSKVTTMYAMFYVRSARALAPTALSRALPVHAACVAATQRPHASRAAPLPTSHARLSTWQVATAFNQPLSFDTSKVTQMLFMFSVRSARALLPALCRSLPPLPLALPPPETPSRLPGRTSSRASHARLSTRQYATAFNQPLSFDTSKVTTMYAMFYVRSARALAPTALSRALPVHANCVAATQRPHASRAVYLFPHHMPAFRLGSARRCSISRSASTRPRSRP